MNRLINMILRRLIRTGVGKGVGAYTRKGGDAEAPQTPEQRRQVRARGRQAKLAARMARRIGRM